MLPAEAKNPKSQFFCHIALFKAKIIKIYFLTVLDEHTVKINISPNPLLYNPKIFNRLKF